MNRPVTLGLIGTGLIGASIGMRARELGWRVIGFDISGGETRAAHARGAIDEALSRESVIEQADTLVIAAPPRATIAELRQLAAAPARAELIIDVCSVKAPICEAGLTVKNFVGTHPLAGSERSGAGAARSTLFFDKPWVYVPSAGKPLEMRARDFIAEMGARAVASNAQEHDDILALTSHVPQLFATVFSKTAKQRGDTQFEAFCGPVAAELLRLGNSNANLWREIFALNGENVARHARDLAAKLEAAARALGQEADSEKNDADEGRAGGHK